jgi:HD-GYP domain-containing protein (c-di-GMP phosphodiesterase class II)
MRTDRPYRKAGTREDALQGLTAFTGLQFDPTIVDAFICILP